MLKKILLVDDDSDDRKLFAEALSRVNSEYDIVFATNGKNAIEKLVQSPDYTPDYIFLDVNMPAWNGWYCLTELKKMDVYKDIPVIMYSTSSNEIDVAKALSLGASHFFTKPDDFEELQKSLGELLLSDVIRSNGS